MGGRDTVIYFVHTFTNAQACNCLGSFPGYGRHMQAKSADGLFNLNLQFFFIVITCKIIPKISKLKMANIVQ